ncbi:TPA: zf-HC2 domain-containing protein [Candidatus Poribacteria bacterium]|nr:zf-HC2 domain-containing protein [Candidatus Poribacteria bacterium]
MKCDRCRELLSWYLESDLRPEEMKKISEHLSVCKECAEELELLEGTLTLARELPQLAPSTVACAQLLNKVKAAAAPKETHFVWEEMRKEGSIETFIREPEPQYSQARIPVQRLDARFRFWTQILKQFNGTWWSFYAEASS